MRWCACVVHVSCCMLHVACCMLRVSCCMLHVACCVCHVACACACAYTCVSLRYVCILVLVTCTSMPNVHIHAYPHASIMCICTQGRSALSCIPWLLLYATLLYATLLYAHYCVLHPIAVWPTTHCTHHAPPLTLLTLLTLLALLTLLTLLTPHQHHTNTAPPPHHHRTTPHYTSLTGVLQQLNPVGHLSRAEHAPWHGAARYVTWLSPLACAEMRHLVITPSLGRDASPGYHP